MKQSKWESFLESAVSTSVGFVISMAAWQFVVAPMFGYGMSIHENLGITGIFTFISVVRQYFVRRVFDGNIYQFVKAKVQHATGK